MRSVLGKTSRDDTIRLTAKGLSFHMFRFHIHNIAIDIVTSLGIHERRPLDILPLFTGERLEVEVPQGACDSLFPGWVLWIWDNCFPVPRRRVIFQRVDEDLRAKGLALLGGRAEHEPEEIGLWILLDQVVEAHGFNMRKRRAVIFSARENLERRHCGSRGTRGKYGAGIVKLQSSENRGVSWGPTDRSVGNLAATLNLN